MGQLTVDADSPAKDTTDDLNISHVTVQSISNRQFTLPISVETFDNTEDTTTLIDCGAEGLFVNESFHTNGEEAYYRNRSKSGPLMGLIMKEEALRRSV